MPLPFPVLLLQVALLLAGCVAPQMLQAQAATPAPASTGPALSPAVPGRYLVVLRSADGGPDALERLSRRGATEVTLHRHLGTAAVSASAAAVRSLAADPAVAQVVPDRVVYAHRLLRSAAVSGAGAGSIAVRSASPIRSVAVEPPAPQGSGDGAGATTTLPTGVSGTGDQPVISDTFYQASAQGWAVRAAGGYGLGLLGGTVAGPWNRTLGTGVRIAVLDSGVDRTHPDLAPNLGLNLSEIDRAAQPSPCDDGSPQDQEGHGTWVASLAAGAMGAKTGRVVGVAPNSTVLNIKVLQRMPGAGTTLAAQCAAGQASGLVSWLLKGIDDAVAQHADVVVLSLGSLVDLYTGDGAGLKAAFDRVTHAAASAGVLIVAAAGNEGFDLSNSRYAELPAQARDVFAVTATTNPNCAEDNRTGASCLPGPVTTPYYSNYGAALSAVGAPGGNYPAGTDEGISGWVRGACSSGNPDTQDGLPTDVRHSMGCFDLGHAAYVQAMGTSASAGLAAGAAALLRAAHPDWSPSAVIAAMRSGTTKTRTGSVLLDTAAALNYQP